MKKELSYILGLLVTLVPCVCLAASASPYGSGWYNEAEIAVAHQDNLSRASKQKDYLSDTTSSFTLGRGYLKKTGTSSQVIFSGYITYTQHADYQDLDNLASTLAMVFIHQPAAGFYKPWYQTSLDVTRLDYKDSDVREGYLLEFDASLNKRITADLIGRVGYQYSSFEYWGKSEQDKLNSQAFDTMSNELYMGVEYGLAGGIYAYAEYGYLMGNFTSSVPKILGWGKDYDAESIDWAFATCRDGICKPRWAYRTDGDIQRGDVGLAFPLFGLNFDLSARYFRAEADSGMTYHDWSIQLGAILEF